MRGAKVELEEAGLETEAMAESTSQLQAKLKALTHGKVDIMIDANTFKNTTQILREMSRAWEDMTDIERASSLELMGGKRQANILSSIITNFQTVEDVIETSMNSQGSALEENAKWLDSIEGKTYQFSNALQTMWMNMIDSEVVKRFIDFGTYAIKFFDTIPGKITAVLVAIAGFAKVKGFSVFGLGQDLVKTVQSLTKAQSILQTLQSTIPVSSNLSAANIQAYGTAVANLTAKQQANMLAAQGLTKAQIQYAMACNGLSEDVIREATAHMYSKITKEEEAQVELRLFAAKTQNLAATLRATAATSSEAAAKELNIVATTLEEAASNNLSKAKLLETIQSLDVSEATKAEVISKLGLSGANKTLAGSNLGLAASIKAVWVALGPLGQILTVVSIAMTFLPGIMDKVITTSEELKQEVNDLTDTYETAKKSFSENIDTLSISSDTSTYKTLQDEFEALTKGVDKYGNNISLTADQYERYKEICDKIVNVNSAIAAGYDSATRAIGNNASVLSDLIELQRIEARENAQEYVKDDNLKKIAKSRINDYKKSAKKNNSLTGADFYDYFLRNSGWGNGNQLKYGDKVANKTDIGEYVLSKLGTTDFNEMQKILDNYYDRNGDFDGVRFLNDYKDKIADAAAEFPDAMQEWANNYKSAKKELESAQNGFIDTLLQVPISIEEYNGLSNASKSWVTEWIKNNTEFKIDDNTTKKQILEYKSQIKTFVRNIANDDYTTTLDSGAKITASDILDEILSLDSSKVNWNQYKQQLQELVDLLWDAIGGDNNTLGFEDKNALSLSIGFDLKTTDDQEQQMIKRYAQIKKITEEEAKKYFDSQPAITVQRWAKIDWNVVDENNIDEVMSQATVTDPTSIKLYSTLSEGVSKFNEILQQTNEIVADNTEVSQEYKDSLTELGISQEELNECFDETNPLIVKNAKSLNNLVKSSKKNLSNNIALAKSQTRLQYYNLVKQLNATLKGTNSLNNSTKNAIQTTLQQIDTVEKALYKYQLLEDSLLGVSNAFEEFNKAKEVDELNTYGDSLTEMGQVVYDALYKTGEVGTEEFKVAIESLIPDAKLNEIYTGYDTDIERMQAMQQYYEENILPMFTVKEDKLSIEYDNIKDFVQKGIDLGVFTGTTENFDLVEGMNLEKAAELLGLSKTHTYALFSELDKYNVSQGEQSFLSQLDDSLEGRISNITSEMEELNRQKYALLKNGGLEKNKEQIDIINQKLAASEQELAKVGSEAYTMWQEYTKNDAAIAALSEIEDKQKVLTSEEAGNLGIQLDEGQTITVQEALDRLLERQTELEKPTELTVTFAIEHIDTEIKKLKSTLDDNNALKVIAETDGKSIETVKSEIEAQIKALEEDKVAIATTFNIELPEEDKKTLQEELNAVEDFKINDKKFTVIADGTSDTMKSLKDINDFVINNKSYTVTKYEKTVTAPTNAPLSSAVGSGRPTKVNGTAHVQGTAFKGGSWGATRSETALTGELGPELRVRGDRWELLGEKGAEFANIQKGDIIFNHKQTEQLLKNGYVTGRGKAYANGTSYGDNSLLSRIKRIIKSNKLDKLAEYAEEMCKQYEELTNGNVDLRKRPHLSPSYEHELAMSGGYNSFIGSDGEIYASTSAETMTIGDGESQYTIDITPVLENGEVLTSDSLAEYVNNLVTDGSMQDLLDSDKYNLIIRAVPGEYNEKDWSGFEDKLSKYKDGYLNTILNMFNLGGEQAVETYGFSPVGLADVSRDLQNNGSYAGKEVASAIDNTSEGMRNLNELINQYVTDVLNAKSLADEIGTDLSKTQYGNVNTDTRQKLYWDEESIDKYSDALDSWGIKSEEIIGTYSTLLSAYSNFDGVDIAFSPMLQTEDGPQLLDSNTVHEYIWGLIDKAKKNDGQWTSEELFQLDTEGLEFNGTIVKNLLEDIGENANTTSKLLHYVGDTGAISNLEKEIETTASELVTTGENISDVQAKLNLLNATNISDKTFTVTTVYQTIGSGQEETVHTHGGSGRYTKYANGTVHINGSAYSSGNFGAPKTETALVGELGPELRVRGSRWSLLGEDGAEFTDIKKGDIIFNHKQTKDLLSQGYVTSRGKAYAGGTAYSGLWKPIRPDKTWSSGDAYSDTSNSLSDAADSISDAADKFEEVFDWVEVRLQEIDEQLNLLNAQLENAVGYIAKNQIIDATLNINNIKLNNLKAGLKEYTNYAAKLLAEVPSQYQEAAKNGAIAIEKFVGDADEKTLEAIKNYREWADKVADLTQQIEELDQEISNLAKQKFDNISDEFDNIVGLIGAANDKLDAQVSLMEDRGYVAAKEYYEAMVENTKQINEELVKERNELQSVLDEQVKLGNIKVGSETWYEMVQQLYDVDASIVECTSDLESFQNAINNIYWDNFDELINRLGYLSDETQNLIDLMDEADMVFTPDNEDGWNANEVTWTEEGLASLGLYAQQMEIAEYQSKQYAKAIEDLNKDYQDGKYSESEYLDKLNELKNAQYDSIESYYDARKAIKDLNQTRIDSIKKGIEKEIEAYDKLIKKKKEELDAEKDIHDFQKSVAEQQKNIIEIQRKLAALSTDTSISAAAKRKQLEAELAQAQYELEEMYYDRSVSDKQDALDKELESFQEEKDKEIEKWEKYLEDIEQVVADSLGIVQANASGIYDTLNNKANEYHLTLSESIASPWKDGTLAISDFQEVFDTAASSTMDQLEQIKLKWQEIIDVMSEKAEIEIDRQEQENNRYIAADNPTSKPSPSPTPNPTPTPAPNPLPSVGQTIRVKTTATHFSAQSGNAKMASFVPGGSYQVMQVGINGDTSQILIGKNGQYTGWIKLSDIEGYAKGAKGIEEDQWAWLDELGEEMQLVPDGNGRLAYIRKGTGILTADMTERLMNLAMNPQEMLDRNRPTISMSPSVTNNNIELTMEIAEVVHIEHVDNDTIPNLTKAIDKQLDKYMKNLNDQIRKYSR